MSASALTRAIGRVRFDVFFGCSVVVVTAWGMPAHWLALAVVFAANALWMFRPVDTGNSDSGYDVINSVLVCYACYLLSKRHWTPSVDDLLQKDKREPRSCTFAPLAMTGGRWTKVSGPSFDNQWGRWPA